MFANTVPMDLDVKIKAVLIGACFLIVSIGIVIIDYCLHIFTQDFMFFEQQQNN